MKCSFCGNEIKQGSGILSIKKDGTVYSFCSPKCERNHKIRRPSDVRWTEEYRRRKKARVQQPKA